MDLGSLPSLQLSSLLTDSEGDSAAACGRRVAAKARPGLEAKVVRALGGSASGQKGWVGCGQGKQGVPDEDQVLLLTKKLLEGADIDCWLRQQWYRLLDATAPTPSGWCCLTVNNEFVDARLEDHCRQRLSN
jgi:hypothetical protein